jgi:hypothetical protein
VARKTDRGSRNQQADRIEAAATDGSKGDGTAREDAEAERHNVPARRCVRCSGPRTSGKPCNRIEGASKEERVRVRKMDAGRSKEPHGERASSKATQGEETGNTGSAHERKGGGYGGGGV